MPQKDAGVLMDQPASDPRAPKHNPAATAAPDPELEPPVPYSVFQGFRAGGNAASKVGRPPKVNSNVLSWPVRIAPASLSFFITVASSFACQSSIERELDVVGCPFR